MKQKNIFLLILLLAISGWIQGQQLAFKDDVESQADFQQNNLEGWISRDLDGQKTTGPYNDFPGKGGAFGFIVYTPSKTEPANSGSEYEPYSGKKYFASISPTNGTAANDWLITKELAPHSGGKFSFYAKTAIDFFGFEKFKVAHSSTDSNPSSFTFFNATATTTTARWVKYEYNVPAGVKHLAINGVSSAYILLIDDIEFVPNISATAPNSITNFTSKSQPGANFQAIFDWLNPTIDNAGNPLANLTGVKIYRGTNPMNLIEVANITSASGQQMTYTDNLPAEGVYNYRFVPYNTSGDGKAYNVPLKYYGYETKPGIVKNVKFSQNSSLQNVISWDKVDYGESGGLLKDPVVGYKIIRNLGNTTEIIANLHPETSYIETTIPSFNLYTYSIIAQTSPTNESAAVVTSAYSGLKANQSSITKGITESQQPMEVSKGSIISQSIYMPSEIGSSGLITSLSYFGNFEYNAPARYKIYMSVTNRKTFGTTPANAKWEYFGTQKLLYDGDVEFIEGRNATTIKLDQPFYYDANSNQNIVITIVKPLGNTYTAYPRSFYNTPVDDMRTYYAFGHTVDLSIITTQPSSWSTEEVGTIPSIVMEKTVNFGSLSGKVTLAADGSPLDEVTVTITPDGANAYQTETVKTNSTGNYTIPALMPGNYMVTFSKNNFNSIQKNIVIAAEEKVILDIPLDNSLPIIISGKVNNKEGNPLEGININIKGFSNASTITDATGNYSLNAFAGKPYQLQATHPLYNSKELSFTSDNANQTIAPITLDITLSKPTNVTAVNNNGVGNIEWRTPVGTFNETTLGWGSFISSGDAWGNGGDPFIAAVRFEPTDLKTKLKVKDRAELTHIKAYFGNKANVIIKIYEGPNAENLIHSQPASVDYEDWHVFELTKSIPVNFDKELWIGIDFLAGQYGAFPIGLDDGPNAPSRKGSMKYENGTWTSLSLTNKNWNIYGIVNNTIDAQPTGYKVYRSPANTENWTELTTSAITANTFSDATLNNATPEIYKYGVSAFYNNTLASEKAISNNIDHKTFFDFVIKLNPNSGSAEGAYVSLWNDNNFVEAYATASGTTLFKGLKRGTYNARIELDNYAIIETTGIIVEENATFSLPLNILKVQPSNLTATTQGTSAKLDWTLHSTYTDKIEKYADFERQNIGNYIMKDLDGLSTYTYSNISYPNAGAPMAFMVFNPNTTAVPVTNMPALSGRKYLTALAGEYGANNDWIIIPAGNGKFTFSAESVTDLQLEQIRVLYSTTGTDVADFTAFEDIITVPTGWKQYSFDAPKGTKYVAINYISDNSFILKVDNLTYEKEYNHALYYKVYLDRTLVKDNLESTNFTLENLIEGEHIVEVEAIYETGASSKTELKITTLALEDIDVNKFSIYPNPSSGKFWLKLDSKATVSIFDLNGRLLYTAQKEAGTVMMDHNFATGNYIIQIKTEKGIISKKLIIK